MPFRFKLGGKCNEKAMLSFKHLKCTPVHTFMHRHTLFHLYVCLEAMLIFYCVQFHNYFVLRFQFSI